MEFTPQSLLQTLQGLTTGTVRRYWVAFSGGLDSSVLLHALAALRQSPSSGEQAGIPRLCAVHINHGLQAEAEAWVRHCRTACDILDIPLTLIEVDAGPAKGQSPEAAAREARYRAFATRVEADDVLLTAQHADDQAETLLLQLLRGAGPKGLASMPPSAPFAAGQLVRPLLTVSRQALQRYAEAEGLVWLEDPSNSELGYNRNYLRHEVIPVLQARWPSLSQTLSRSAELCAEAAQVLDERAQEDMSGLIKGRNGGLSIAGLSCLPEARRYNVLRLWLQQAQRPLPSRTHLQRILGELVPAAGDAVPLVHWPGAEVRRYRDILYAMQPLPSAPADISLPWTPGPAGCGTIALPDGLGSLSSIAVQGSGIKASWFEQDPLEIRFRQGGERCRLAGRCGSHSLKHLLQERGVPPWERSRLPLLTIGGELAAVADLWVCEPFAARHDEEGLKFRWDADFRTIVD